LLSQYYNVRTKGYQGVEALPQIEFWRNIPGLVTDGVAFSRQKVQEYRDKRAGIATGGDGGGGGSGGGSKKGFKGVATDDVGDT